MEIQIRKLYLVIDENNIIQKGYFRNTEKEVRGVWFHKGANFDITKDFEKAIVVDGIDFDEINFGVDKLIDGVFTSNKEEK